MRAHELKEPLVVALVHVHCVPEFPSVGQLVTGGESSRSLHDLMASGLVDYRIGRVLGLRLG
jgi:hypothetical protein